MESPNISSSGLNNKLSLIKASAGSGKTFTLVKEYLKLLFSNEPTEHGSYHHDAYTHILGVTFTNKATGEMKQRIIEELTQLQDPLKAKHHPYYEELLPLFTGKTEEAKLQKLSIASQKYLANILNDYGNFQIKTIDAFFQQIIRSFATDIDINPDFAIELNASNLQSQAIDTLFTNIDQAPLKDEKKALLSFMKDSLQNAENWDLRYSIEAFVSNVLEKKDELTDENLQQIDFSALRKALREAYEDKFDEFRHFQSKFKEILDAELPDIKPKVALQYFLDLESINDLKSQEASKNLKALQASEGIQDYYAKKSFEKLYPDFCPSAPLTLTHQGFLNTLSSCYTLLLINSNKSIMPLVFVKAIKKYIGEALEENNQVLISDSSSFISKIVSDSPTPFIYEKIGIKINHYLLDEFQDTSDIQWNNFKPLIEESLDNNHHNLIVGDGKQSIYRFRGANSQLINTKIKEELREQAIETTLNTNFRSTPTVISFNNTLFSALAQALKEDNPDQSLDLSYYDTVKQIVPKSKRATKGEVVLLKSKRGNASTVWKDSQQDIVIREIERLHQLNGYKYKDMCVLVRNRSEATNMVNKLITQSIPTLSSDALMLNTSRAIALVVNTLKYIIKPQDTLTAALVKLQYSIILQFRQNPNTPYLDLDFNKALISEQEMNQHFSHFLSNQNQPIYQLVDMIISRFNLNEEVHEQPYLLAFQDLVLDFSETYSSDINLFIQSWESNYKDKSTLSTPENSDAVQVLTIHKSKGLGFKAVFVPHIDYDLTPNKSTTYWDNKQTLLPLLPHYSEAVPALYPILGNSSILKFSIFKPLYDQETIDVIYDTLNLLYVACTRSKDYLFVGYADLSSTSHKISNDLTQIINTWGDELTITQEATPDTESYTLSHKIVTLEEAQQLQERYKDSFKGQKEETLENFIAQIEESKCFETFALKVIDSLPTQEEGRREERNKERKEEVEGTNSPKAILLNTILAEANKEANHKMLVHHLPFVNQTEAQRGTLIHNIMSQIKDKTDAPEVLQQYIHRQLISREEAQKLNLSLDKLFADQEIGPWFSTSNFDKVLCESAIMSAGNALYRTDRVMIKDHTAIIVDYKTGAENPAYHKQIQNYCALFTQMGYESTGYLLYFDSTQEHINKPLKVQVV